MRSIVKGKGSTLAKHQCNQGYDLQIIARAENRKEALRLMEGKMMNKYKPKINIKDEKKAREIAEKMGKALRDRGSCKPDSNLPEDPNNDDYEDQFEYWIQASDAQSDEFDTCVEHEDENGEGMSEAEASKTVSGEPKIAFNAANYTLLAAIKAHENEKPFTTTTLGSKDASDMGIEVRDPSIFESFWYSTPIGILTDSSKTLGERVKNLWYTHPIGKMFDPSKTAQEKVIHLGLTVATFAVFVIIPFAAPAAAATTSSVMVAKLGVKTAACGAAYMIPVIGPAAPIVCAAA
jgi:hypothetical protein